MREWERGLAVVILNYNGYDLTIESTNNFRKIGSELNIIIVDNCSKNDSLEKLKGAFSDDKNTHIIANDKNTGYASGNNVGLRYISDNLKQIKAVCISNPDIFVESASVLENLYNALLEDESLAVVLFCLLKSMCQVIGVIVSLNYRVINAGIWDPDPCNDIRIDLF